MNHIFRVVFNHVCQTYQAVAEIAKGQSKSETAKPASSTHKKSRTTLKTALRPLSVLIAMAPLAVHAAPTGGHISAGDASISQHGKITNIQQNSQKAAINWQSFGIKADETVNFKQPNAQAVILNRVIGNEKSVIDGAMNANGKVFISNPNGMIFGKNAQINVGALLATTAKIKDQDFMNGFFKFDEATGDITHLGDIKVPTGGVVALIAPIVENKGKITAPQGKVLLASAEQFSITLPDNGQFAYTLDRGTLQGLVGNGGAILADGGHVILTAKGTDAVKKSLIKHTGKIEANTVQNKNGVIELLGDLDNSRLEVSGSLKAEAKEKGDGGFIETSAADVKIQETAQISTQAKNGKTGTWLIDPKDFTVSDGTGEHTETGIGAETLSNNLQKTDIKIQTVATGSEQGNIYVNAPVSWDKNKLTLSAHNDIHINKTLNGTGTAKLALEYGQGTADGGESDYYIKYGAKVNLPTGQTFSTKLGDNGKTEVFDVIHQLPEINGEESTFTSKNIAFGADMDLSHTSHHNNFGGWSLPEIENTKVHGLGHTLNSLDLQNSKDFTGLVKETFNSELKDIHLSNVRIQGKNQVGGLVGVSQKTSIKNSTVSGQISGDYYIGGLVGNADEQTIIENSSSQGQVRGNDKFGGLVGVLGESKIKNSHSTSEIIGDDDTWYAGGLVGLIDNSQIEHSYATGNVRGFGYLGGLVGSEGTEDSDNTGKSIIANSYATGSVHGSQHLGGLIGNTQETQIKKSHATGKVMALYNSNGWSIGGLVGSGNLTEIQSSYSTGDVSGKEDVGGLVGFSYGDKINQSYSSSDVTAVQEAGGLIGTSVGSQIKNSYSTGIINEHTTNDNTSNLYLGGLVGAVKAKDGLSHTQIHNSYFAGQVDATENTNAVGAIVGGNTSPSVQFTATNVFFDQDVSTVKDGGSVLGEHYGVGKTTAELKQKSTYTGWDFDNTWGMKDGELPHLKAVSQSSTVTPVPPVKPIQPNPATLLDDAKKAVAHAELIFKNMKEKQRKVVIEAGQPLDLEPMNKEITKAFIQAKNAVGKLSDGADKDQLAKRLEVIHTLNEIKPVTPPSNPVTPTNPNSNADYQKAQEAFSHAETVRKNMLNNQERFVKAGKSELANQSLNNWNREIQNAINKAQEAIAKLPNGKDKTILTHKLKGITLLSSVSVNNTRPTNTVSPTTSNGNGHTTSHHTTTNTNNINQGNNTNPPKTPPTKKPENTDIGNALTNGAQAGTLPYTGLAAVDGATSAQNTLKQEQGNHNKFPIKKPNINQALYQETDNTLASETNDYFNKTKECATKGKNCSISLIDNNGNTHVVQYTVDYFVSRGVDVTLAGTTSQVINFVVQSMNHNDLKRFMTKEAISQLRGGLQLYVDKIAHNLTQFDLKQYTEVQLVNIMKDIAIKELTNWIKEGVQAKEGSFSELAIDWVSIAVDSAVETVLDRTTPTKTKMLEFQIRFASKLSVYTAKSFYKTFLKGLEAYEAHKQVLSSTADGILLTAHFFANIEVDKLKGVPQEIIQKKLDVIYEGTYGDGSGKFITQNNAYYNLPRESFVKMNALLAKAHYLKNTKNDIQGAKEVMREARSYAIEQDSVKIFGISLPHNSRSTQRHANFFYQMRDLLDMKDLLNY